MTLVGDARHVTSSTTLSGSARLFDRRAGNRQQPAARGPRLGDAGRHDLGGQLRIRRTSGPGGGSGEPIRFASRRRRATAINTCASTRSAAARPSGRAARGRTRCSPGSTATGSTTSPTRRIRSMPASTRRAGARWAAPIARRSARAASPSSAAPVRSPPPRSRSVPSNRCSGSDSPRSAWRRRLRASATSRSTDGVASVWNHNTGLLGRRAPRGAMRCSSPVGSASSATMPSRATIAFPCCRSSAPRTCAPSVRSR